MAWSKSTRIIIMLVIDVMFFALELGVGLTVGSLALMADAFHMLNDIISLVVGLWAVKAAQKASSDRYSFGWLRAEILGAFFNAVFLIALCLSIILEAVTRFIDPPIVSNPKLILIVGSLGLASNLAGFFVLGGHGHAHGGGHDHEGHIHADETRTAEEGNSDNVSISEQEAADENARAIDVLPEAAVGRVVRRNSRRSSESARAHIKFTSSDETASTSKGSETSVSLGRFNGSAKSSRRNAGHNRRASSILSTRLANPNDISIHPASFRQDIIAASRTSLEDIQSEDTFDAHEDAIAEQIIIEEPNEHSPLRSNPSDGLPSKPAGSDPYAYSAINRDSWHDGHNHNKPKKASKGHHGHDHGDMGMRAMVLHVIGDALGNVGVIASALIIWLTDSPGRFYADPAVSLFITIIILRSAIPLTSATAKILLQATPDHLDVNDIREDIQHIPGVVSCHHVHIWQLSDSQIIASMHIQVAFPISSEDGAERYMELAKAARKCLHAYGIHSATIQPEFCTDRAHDHVEVSSLGLDGVVTRKDDADSCLLECIEDCVGKSCCSSRSPPLSSSFRSQDEQRMGGHEENGHDQSHNHGNENGSSNHAH